MFDSAVLDARIAISSAFVIGYTRVNTAARPLTSVSITVSFACIRRTAVLGGFSVPFRLLSINGAVVPDIRGSTCTWGWFPDTSPTYPCTAVRSPVIYVAITASCWGGEVASKNVRRCAGATV